MDITDLAIEAFADIGKLAIVQELKIRLLANLRPETSASAFAFKLSDAELSVVEFFKEKQRISDAEIELLAVARRIRNKILHCEFDDALAKIVGATGRKPPGPPVRVISGLENATGEELIQQILDFGAAKDVGETTMEEGALLGWLLHMIQTGAFEDARGIFLATNNIIERLIGECQSLG